MKICVYSTSYILDKYLDILNSYNGKFIKQETWEDFYIINCVGFDLIEFKIQINKELILADPIDECSIRNLSNDNRKLISECNIYLEIYDNYRE